MGTLSPLAEEPISEEEGISAEKGSTFRSWLKNLQLFHRKPNFKVLLSVMACPLSPVSILPKQSLGVASSAEYIIRQFRATSGCSKMETNPTKSMYVAGRVAVAGKHGATSATSFSSQQGSFVMWQMSPTKWLLNLRVAGLHVSAGSDGHVAWRRTPWLTAHAAKGGVRPLRRALQGLDPMTIAAVFSAAHHITDKQIDAEECFVLRLDVDASKLSYQSDNTVEIIEHMMFGSFSERSGLLLHLEDSQLMRIQYCGGQGMYWKTTMSSWMKDYEAIDGVMVARSGRSVVKLEQFGVEGEKMMAGSMIMEEKWIIDDVDFKVSGLSADFFIPPEEIKT
ncbi:uncharacterized protein LOC110023790 isoform X2 [Phalaenopsis equestris]|uniref:uncharacterized protein LOC110023790 isoform X1 n=1 Tax=Phalaenopsis equestris TaxID=78828 RepID=UPI0009E5F4A0|nr:uncharacterized protein LOC110023790 isoform X1 [Phalaenopsis equestris]XP_020579034.1 uncharacterized protein LOC110023790 isoform X1 [Phalaenopsis equestris]XP_020579035.1 uncharacterized protein LOC110023790 isoform X2 [Phalaenopsis equestris]